MLKKVLNFIFLFLIIYFSLIIFYNKPDVDYNNINLLEFYNQFVNYILVILFLYVCFLSFFGKHKLIISFITLTLIILLFIYYYNPLGEIG
ncbi:MAG: hypothetical protein CVU03_14165 [Bacteroidetes bacterium HGW-Bacteroidetes-2]|jgi:L-asparagine transporter-like permease|nr:MAG: hypothetical protein CVU03_14165 [Bacteroidetes bacterium HGW-Bacteroidetes-2]